MEFKGTIKNGGLAFADFILKERQDYLDSAKPGTKIVEDIKKYRTTKTQKQLAYLFGCAVDKVITPAIIENGYTISRVLSRTILGNRTTEVVQQIEFPMGFGNRDVLDRFLYPWCGVYDDEGGLIRLSQMYVDEAVRFVENIKHASSDYLGAFVPDPDPDWYKNFKEKPNV